MKKIIILFTIFYIFLFVTNVNAATCSYSELKELKKLAQKVEIGYEPSIPEKGENARFTLKVYNLDSRFKITNPMGDYIDGNDSFKSEGIFVSNSEAGSTIKFVVYASSKSACSDERLTSFSVELPVYNKYFNREECKENETNKVCRKWYDASNLSEKKFKELTTVKKEKTESLFSKIVKILISSPVAIIAIVAYILIVILAVVIVNKRKVKMNI